MRAGVESVGRSRSIAGAPALGSKVSTKPEPKPRLAGRPSSRTEGVATSPANGRLAGVDRVGRGSVEAADPETVDADSTGSGSLAGLMPKVPIKVSHADRLAGFSATGAVAGTSKPGTTGSVCRITISASGSRGIGFPLGDSTVDLFSPKETSGFFFVGSLAAGSAGPGVPRRLASSFQWSDIICNTVFFSWLVTLCVKRKLYV